MEYTQRRAIIRPAEVTFLVRKSDAVTTPSIMARLAPSSDIVGLTPVCWCWSMCLHRAWLSSWRTCCAIVPPKSSVLCPPSKPPLSRFPSPSAAVRHHDRHRHTPLFDGATVASLEDAPIRSASLQWARPPPLPQVVACKDRYTVQTRRRTPPPGQRGPGLSSSLSASCLACCTPGLLGERRRDYIAHFVPWSRGLAGRPNREYRSASPLQVAAEPP